VTILGDGTNQSVVTTWKRIDATRPTKSIDQVSYRYPFVDAQNVDGVAPCVWTGWDGYQGPEQEVRDAVDELIQRAGIQVALWEKR